MPSVPNIIGYHCNDVARCQKFVAEDYLVWDAEDGEWLGSGMYFWDNMYNAAVYWKRHKKYQDPSKNYIVVSANIATDHLLDLTDYDIANKVARVWDSYCEILHRTTAAPLGKKLNFLFDHNHNFSSHFYVLKIYGKYNGTWENQLFGYDVRSKHNEPTLSVKCIYSIRNAKCILNKSICNGSGEN